MEEDLEEEYLDEMMRAIKQAYRQAKNKKPSGPETHRRYSQKETERNIMQDKLDLSNVETQEQLHQALEAFRKRNGIVLKEPEYPPFRWCEENLEKYRQELQCRTKKCVSRKLFYLEQTGSVWKNERLIAVVTQLMCGYRLPEKEVCRILEDAPPLLRIDVMEETEPGSGQFRPRSFDLVHTALQLGEKELLERLLPYIDFERRSRESAFAMPEENP